MTKSRIIRPAYILLGVIIIFLGRDILPINGNFIGGRDIIDQGVWSLLFVKEQFLSGSIPLWNPYYYCGHPFLANPANSIFYPSILLLFVPLPFPWACNLDTLLHVYLAAMGMYYLVGMLTESKGAGLASAIVYSMSGYFADRIFAGHITYLHIAGLLPWIFYFCEKAYKTERLGLFSISGLLIGLQILDGDPQDTYYTCLFLTVYCFVRYFLEPFPFQFQRFFRFCKYFFLIPAVAFGVSAIQILPSLEFKSVCDRAKDTYEFATLFSFAPQNFFTFLVPKPPTHPAILNTNWEFGGYLGILSLILAGIGATWSGLRRHSLCFGIMIFIAITIMLGHYTPIYRVYYNWLPGISTFRIPARCMVIFVFSMAILVGFGVRRLCKSRLTRRQHCLVMFVLAIFSLCLWVGAKAFEIPLGSKEMLTAYCLIICATVVLNLIRFVKKGHVVAGLLIAGLFVDLYVSNAHLIPKVNQGELLKKYDYEVELERHPGFYRVNVPHPSGSGLSLRGMKFHYYGVNGFTNLVISDFFQFVHRMADLPVPKLMRHTLSPRLFKPQLVFSSKILGIKYALVKTQTGYEWLETDSVMPRAVLVRDAVVLPHDKEIDYMKRAGFDPERQVLLEASPEDFRVGISEEAPASGNSDIVKIVHYEPNRIELKSESRNDTYLVLSELYYPGWHAYVDGKEEKILRADFILRAIPLGPGKHDIAFVYRPKSFLVGAAITIFTILLLGGIFLLHMARRRRAEVNEHQT